MAPYGVTHLNFDGTVFEMLWWQPDMDGLPANLYNDIQMDPPDGIYPPPFQRHHNQMIALKDDDHVYQDSRFDSEGFLTSPEWSTDYADSADNWMDEQDKEGYKDGLLSKDYMILSGFGDWVEEWDAGVEQRHEEEKRRLMEYYAEQEAARERRLQRMTGRVPVTDSMLAERAQMNDEERSFNEYLQRRRERRSNRDY